MGSSIPKVSATVRQKLSMLHERVRKSKRFDLRLLCFGLLCFCACFSVFLYLPLPLHAAPALAHHTPERVCAAHLAKGQTHSGFQETPVDSIVLMLYTPDSTSSDFCYGDGNTNADTTVEREFLRVAASYVSSPYAAPSSPYHDFFTAHNATLWTVDRAARVATPMRLDVVYTYVNPRAPSFERHLKMRKVPFEQRRYRDWEELRYSLRSLRAFVLDNAALAQYHRRHAADVHRLGELGYRVNESDVAAAGGVVSLVRRVYLVVSDVDQVPAWLDAEKFPQLRVVTHHEMFSAEEVAWVLPTLNSNVIESGLHRIPDISRFFLYINNDMLVGRKMSFFDLFRPLSPLRQRLRLYDMAAHTEENSAALSSTIQSTDRAALLLEPVLHSDTQEMEWTEGSMTAAEAAATSKVQGELGSCLLQSVRANLNKAGKLQWLNDSVLQPAWSTTKGFALHDPGYGATARGAGVGSPYYYHLTSTHIDGVELPFGYAHIPQLVDRDVYRRLNEVELFDLTNATRKAYEREMHPFSPIDEYALFAVAMARGAERHVWSTVWRNAPADAFRDVRQELHRWWWENLAKSSHSTKKLTDRLSHKLQLSMFGALYGDTWGVQLQRPDFALEMGYWWVRDTVSSVRHSRKLSSLKALYAIPEVASGERCRAQPTQWTARSDGHYFSLLHDMYHHTKRDSTFFFEMVDSNVKTMLIAARLKYEWVDRPLFMCFNDNFPSSADFKTTKAVFNALLKIVSHSCPPAPWERIKTG